MVGVNCMTAMQGAHVSRSMNQSLEIFRK